MKTMKAQSVLLALALTTGLISIPTVAQAAPTQKAAYWSLYQGTATGIKAEAGKKPVNLGPGGKPVADVDPTSVGSPRATKTPPGKKDVKDDAARAKQAKKIFTKSSPPAATTSPSSTTSKSVSPQTPAESLNGPQSYETLDPSYCWWNDDPQVLEVYSHLYECSGGLVDATSYDSQYRVIGHAWLHVWTYNEAWSANPNYTWAPTQVLYRQTWTLDHLEGDTTGFEDLTFQLGTRCRPSDEILSTCTTTGPSTTTGAALELTDPVTVEEAITFSPNFLGAIDGDFSLIYFQSTQYIAITSGNAVHPLLDFGQDRVRCDSGFSLVHLKAYFGGSNGCVFETTNGLLSYYTRLDVSNPDIRESSQHVADALNSNNNPSVTIYPPRTGLRVIPGTPDYPLTRGYERVDSLLVAAACDLYFPGYAAQVKDCDEYAFASTDQGAANPFYDFSVRAISRSDNRSSGTYLQWWYETYRMLPTVDHFAVYVNVPCLDCSCQVC